MIICIPVELIKRTISETLNKGNDICSVRDMRALSRGCVRLGHVKKKSRGWIDVVVEMTLVREGSREGKKTEG